MPNNIGRTRRRKHTADVILKDGWAACSDGDFPFVGATAETEKGEAFLSAYCAEQPGPEPVGDYVIAAAHLLPKELDHFRRMAAAAGVSVDDQTRAAR